MVTVSPDTPDPMDTGPCAFKATFTVTTIEEVDPGLSTALVVQEALEMLQFQVAPPLSPVNVSPFGTDSTIVTPDAGPAFAAFATVRVKTELWPCINVVADSVTVKAETFAFVNPKLTAVETPVTAAVTE